MRLIPPGTGAVLRSPDEAHRTSTPLELLFDLCFVVAVAQVAAELHHGVADHHVGTTIIGYALTFFAIWWAWVNFTWFASAHDSDDVVYRLLTLLQMTGVLVLAAGVHEAVVDRDFTVVVVGYVVMRLALVTQWLRVARDHPAERPRALRYAVGISVLQVLWVARLALPDAFDLPSFALLMAAEMWVPWSGERRGVLRFNAEHVVERYGLFTIIVLGEAILAATLAVNDAIDAQGLSFEVLVVALSALVTAFALWWVYFARPGEIERERPWTSFLWGYGHLPVFAGIAAFGAGVQVATDSLIDAEEVSARSASITVTLGVAIALAGLVIVNLGATDVRTRRMQAAIVALAGALVVVGLIAPVVAAMALTALAVAGLVVWKVVQHGASGVVAQEGAAIDG